MKPGDAYRAIGLAAALAALALLTDELMTLILGVVVAVILSLPLAAAADLAQRRGLPRTLGALVALALLSALGAGLAVVLVPQFIAQVRQFAQRLPSTLDGAAQQLGATRGTHAATLSGQLQSLIDGFVSHPQRLLGPLTQLGGELAVVLGGVVVIVIVAFTLAVSPEPAISFVTRLLPAGRRPLLRDVLGRVRRVWLGWMLAVGIDMLVLGSLLWLGLTIIGLPFAIGFATFSALMTVIPNYGSIISAIPPILAGLSQSTGQAILVLVVYVIVNQIEGNLILPLIMARTVDLHPAVVAIGLLAMSALFGLIGVFIAIPLLSLLIILVQALWIEPQEAAAGLGPPPTATPGPVGPRVARLRRRREARRQAP